MAKQLDREKQVQQIIDSALYRSGETFTAAGIASLLNLTVSQSRDLMNHMATTGQVVKKYERVRRGSARTGMVVYQRPTPMILRKAWRKRSNESIGIRV